MCRAPAMHTLGIRTAAERRTPQTRFSETAGAFFAHPTEVSRAPGKVGFVGPRARHMDRGFESLQKAVLLDGWEDIQTA